MRPPLPCGAPRPPTAPSSLPQLLLRVRGGSAERPHIATSREPADFIGTVRREVDIEVAGLERADGLVLLQFVNLALSEYEADSRQRASCGRASDRLRDSTKTIIMCDVSTTYGQLAFSGTNAYTRFDRCPGAAVPFASRIAARLSLGWQHRTRGRCSVPSRRWCSESWFLRRIRIAEPVDLALDTRDDDEVRAVTLRDRARERHHGLVAEDRRAVRPTTRPTGVAAGPLRHFGGVPARRVRTATVPLAGVPCWRLPRHGIRLRGAY